MEEGKLKYDIEVAKKLTGIEDEKLLDFYIQSVIKKIERQIGYELVRGQITSLVSGLDKNYVFLPRKKIEKVLNASSGCKILPFDFVNRKVIFDEIIPKNAYVEIEYIVGYETLPEDLLFFICSFINEAKSNEEGLKSYSIRGISYTFLSKIEQSDNFIRGVRDFFGIVEI
ncbi:hypothetical protein [Fusobacterium necrophorum]|uniref:hypothetical protein n=1 Tax=Fusobacterium necrophorum TaxID=859 RepID=UPI00370ED20C